MILVGGEALMDRIVHPDGRVDEVPGGGPFNTARTLARLGVRVAFVGGLSDDPAGRRLRTALAADGVDLSLVQTTDRPTAWAVAELDSLGVASYSFSLDETAATVVSPADVAVIPMTGVGAVHVGTLGLVVEPLASAMEALVDAAPDDAVVMLDPNCRGAAIRDRATYLARIRRLLGRTDVVKVSSDDLAYLYEGIEPADAVGALLAGGPSVVLWTDGAGPVRVVTPRGIAALDVPHIAVVDTVGAGDAFSAGFLAAWIGTGRSRRDLGSDDHLVVSVRRAIRVASLTCTRPGADPPTADELAAWVPAG